MATTTKAGPDFTHDGRVRYTHGAAGVMVNGAGRLGVYVNSSSHTHSVEVCEAENMADAIRWADRVAAFPDLAEALLALVGVAHPSSDLPNRFIVHKDDIDAARAALTKAGL